MARRSSSTSRGCTCPASRSIWSTSATRRAWARADSPSPGWSTSCHGLAEGPRDRLDAVAAWPLAAVVDGVALTGVVLPRIPDAYFQDVVLPSGTAETVVREVQYLFVPPDRNKRIGMPMPDDDQRLRICRDLADLLAFLHDDLAVAFGDLNAKNELFRLDAEPMIMLVDCDAARTRGDTSAQPNTPDWIPLDPHEPLSRLSDRYKLGLFILRCLTPGPQGSTRTDPSAAQILDAEGIDLLRGGDRGTAASATGRPGVVPLPEPLSR